MVATIAQDNTTLARRIYGLFSNNKLEDVLALVAEDAEVVLMPTGQTFHGREGFTQFMQGFKSAFPDIQITITNQVASADSVVSEFIAGGTNTGPLSSPAGALPATGKRAEWPVCEVWQIRDGQLTSLHNYQDMATMLRQLGLIS